MACSLKYSAANISGAAHSAAAHAVQTLLHWACALYPAGLFPKDVFHADIFQPAELRLPDWFVITKDEFLQKNCWCKELQEELSSRQG